MVFGDCPVWRYCSEMVFGDCPVWRYCSEMVFGDCPVWRYCSEMVFGDCPVLRYCSEQAAQHGISKHTHTHIHTLCSLRLHLPSIRSPVPILKHFSVSQNIKL